MTISVYGICDPATSQIFYVGLTTNGVWYRLSQHACRPESAAYHRIREIMGAGEQPILMVFRVFGDMEEARAFERDLICLINEPLLNRETRYAFAGGRIRTDGERRFGNGTVRGPYDVTVEPFDDGWGPYEEELPC